MNRHLLVAASALAVGLSFSSVALADGKPKTTDVSLAGTVQGDAVLFDFAKGTAASNTLGAVYGTGLANIQQNGGANSIQSDANTLAAILNADNAQGNNAKDTNVPIALSAQVAVVAGNASIGAVNTTSKGAEQSAAFHEQSKSFNEQSVHGIEASSGIHAGFSAQENSDDSGSISGGFSAHKQFFAGHEQSASFNEQSKGGYEQSAWWNKTSDAVTSYNSLDSFGGTGMFNVSQNVGNNSMQQSANTAAVVIGR